MRRLFLDIFICLLHKCMIRNQLLKAFQELGKNRENRALCFVSPLPAIAIDTSLQEEDFHYRGVVVAARSRYSDLGKLNPKQLKLCNIPYSHTTPLTQLLIIKYFLRSFPHLYDASGIEHDLEIVPRIHNRNSPYTVTKFSTKLHPLFDHLNTQQRIIQLSHISKLQLFLAHNLTKI